MNAYFKISIGIFTLFVIVATIIGFMGGTGLAGGAIITLTFIPLIFFFFIAGLIVAIIEKFQKNKLK